MSLSNIPGEIVGIGRIVVMNRNGMMLVLLVYDSVYSMVAEVPVVLLGKIE